MSAVSCIASSVSQSTILLVTRWSTELGNHSDRLAWLLPMRFGKPVRDSRENITRKRRWHSIQEIPQIRQREPRREGRGKAGNLLTSGRAPNAYFGRQLRRLQMAYWPKGQ